MKSLFTENVIQIYQNFRSNLVKGSSVRKIYLIYLVPVFKSLKSFIFFFSFTFRDVRLIYSLPIKKRRHSSSGASSAGSALTLKSSKRALARKRVKFEAFENISNQISFLAINIQIDLLSLHARNHL